MLYFNRVCVCVCVCVCTCATNADNVNTRFFHTFFHLKSCACQPAPLPTAITVESSADCFLGSQLISRQYADCGFCVYVCTCTCIVHIVPCVVYLYMYMYMVWAIGPGMNWDGCNGEPFVWNPRLLAGLCRRTHTCMQYTLHQ